MAPTTRDTACFEAGVKFGSLYHQFAGTPVSPESAPALGRAMEAAIENQPHCRSVTVSMREGALEADLDPVHGYTELSGQHFEAEVVVEYQGVVAVARMSMSEGYPLMELESVEP
ncbi:MAG: dihydroneopterin aldolase family protein [Halobacteriales archaeon]